MFHILPMVKVPTVSRKLSQAHRVRSRWRDDGHLAIAKHFMCVFLFQWWTEIICYSDSMCMYMYIYIYILHMYMQQYMGKTKAPRTKFWVERCLFERFGFCPEKWILQQFQGETSRWCKWSIHVTRTHTHTEISSDIHHRKQTSQLRISCK